jgi:pseudouridine-5'-phosphate glycosidase
VKSILDVPATLERLETLSIPVLGYQTNRFPGFYLQDSGYGVEHAVNSANEIADIYRAGLELKSHAAIVVANPAPAELAREMHDQLLVTGLNAAHENKITGKAVTPFLLEYFHRESKGASLDVNVEIIKSNSRLAAQIAVALA